MGSLLSSNGVPMAQLSATAASITSSYTLIGIFSAPMVYGYIVSTLDDVIQLSFDGVGDHLVVPAGDSSTVIIPLDLKNNLITLPTPSFSVKEIGNPTTGNLYICGFSASLI